MKMILGITMAAVVCGLFVAAINSSIVESERNECIHYTSPKQPAWCAGLMKD